MGRVDAVIETITLDEGYDWIVFGNPDMKYAFESSMIWWLSWEDEDG